MKAELQLPEHSLPFRMILEEYGARRGDELQQFVADVLRVDKEHAWNQLSLELDGQEAKYRELAKCRSAADTLPGVIDTLERECHELDKPFKWLLHKMNGHALCLSGGGIRSASFGLGVLEGLSRFSIGILNPTQESTPEGSGPMPGLLHNLDYLSTVSGGGYIGSWLTAWVHRKQVIERARAEVESAAVAEESTGPSWHSHVVANPTSAVPHAEQNAADKREEASEAPRNHLDRSKRETCGQSYHKVIKMLAGASYFTSADPAPRPVRHLREFTSYLAPAMGLSLDVWALATIVIRNLLVNWVMLVPLLLAWVALPQISHLVSHDLAWCMSHYPTFVPLLSILISALLFFRAADFAGRELPSHRKPRDAGPKLTRIAIGFTVPILVANWFVGELWWGLYDASHNTVSWRRAYFVVVFLVAFLVFVALARLLFQSYRDRILQRSQRKLSNLKNLVTGSRGFILRLRMLASAIVSAWVTAGLLEWLAGRVFPYLVTKTYWKLWKFSAIVDDRLFAIFALPLITIVPFLTVSLFSGLLGSIELEEDREWWARAAGLQFAMVVGWIVVHALALYSMQILGAVGGLLLGGIGSALGWSGATSAGPRPVKAAQLGKVGTFLVKHDLLLPTLCGVALLLLTMGVAGVELRLATRFLGGMDGHLVVFLGSLLGGVLLNRAINVNLFSLHGMYRMRLMRAFLGASNTKRYPDSFTQFDPQDTPLVADLPKEKGVPLHIINTTLNLVGTKNLAWRQRKAESFTFSPLHSGAWRLAYVPADIYGGTQGVSLATAMAISGAAFNPNMGYHSSPLVTLLMTLFNVRLGWWLPNPAKAQYSRWRWSAKGRTFLHKSGPTMALEPLLLDLFGLTDDTYRWIELSDGGHFENLGLYEMVLRRCHCIVVVDAGADPKCQFEDLGNALRKIEIDLGIPIRFNDRLRMKAGAIPENRYCAVAEIDYGCVDGDCSRTDAALPLAGTLIYIKAAITGNEPPDIKQYALTHADFPHETTANQFFNEAQFESYRHLGSYEVEAIIREGLRQIEVPAKEGAATAEIPAVSPLGMDFKSFATVARSYAKRRSRSTKK